MLALLRGAGVPLPADAVIEHIRAGRYMRAAGAWRWRVMSAGGGIPSPLVGSQWRLADLLEVGKLVASEVVGAECEIAVDPAAPTDRATYRQWILVKPS